MTDLKGPLLESWDRQLQIWDRLIALIDENNKAAKPAPDGWPISTHLGHIHEVRHGWIESFAPEEAEKLPACVELVGEDWKYIDDLATIRSSLAESGPMVGRLVGEKIDAGATKIGPYSHPIFFLQHMLWHEAYHFSLIILALRNIGQEPPESWDDDTWQIWKT